MALKIIGIDAAYGGNFSCVSFGFDNDVKILHDQISMAMFGKKDCILHWANTTKKIKQKAQKNVFEAIQNSSVQFYVFEHKKPLGAERKDYFLTFVPNSISNYIYSKLVGKYGAILVESDKDFEVRGVSESTLCFVHNFLFQICFKLVGKPVTIRKEGQDLRATIKFPNQNKLEFIGRTNQSNNSKAIQLADIVLGYKLNTKGLEKVFYRKI